MENHFFSFCSPGGKIGKPVIYGENSSERKTSTNVQLLRTWVVIHPSLLNERTRFQRDAEDKEGTRW